MNVCQLASNRWKLILHTIAIPRLLDQDSYFAIPRLLDQDSYFVKRLDNFRFHRWTQMCGILSYSICEKGPIPESSCYRVCDLAANHFFKNFGDLKVAKNLLERH